MKSKLTFVAVALVALAMSSCGGGGQQGDVAAPAAEQAEATAPSGPVGQATVVDEESDPNIVQVAVGSADHTTLVAAVQAAELVDVLANNGPFTVFAPVNTAFDALPEGTVENLLKPENKATLARIIKYHAAPGTYGVDRLKDGQKLFMATGHYIDIAKAEDGTITLQGAKILGSVQAANGIIHVIDKVLLIPEAS
jgi:uncharacterized surface protein with fasciclin (FAS1) repeats